MRADVVDGVSVRMVERRRRACLLLEARKALDVSVKPSGNTLMATLRPSRVSRARATSPIPGEGWRRGNTSSGIEPVVKSVLRAESWLCRNDNVI